MRRWAPWRGRPNDPCSGTPYPHGRRRQNRAFNAGAAQRRARAVGDMGGDMGDMGDVGDMGAARDMGDMGAHVAPQGL